MYLSPQNKFGFISVPRTGSHAFQKGLKSSIVESGLSHTDDLYIMDDEITTPKQLGTFPIDPKELRDFLGLNWGFPRNAMFPDNFKYYVMMHHLTPAHMVKGGLIQESELSSYNLFGFVRDPIKRWLSHAFLTAEVTRDLKTGFEREYVIEFIRSKLERLPYPPMIMPFMEDYFYYNGALVATPYTNDRMVEIQNTLVLSLGGSSIQELPIIRPMGATIPDNCRAPIQDWLPSDCLDKLQNRLQPDIDFYNKVVNNAL